jgi:hypothetical protein
MTEHRTASFVCSMAWAVFLGMEVAIFAGYWPTKQGAVALIMVLMLALVASAICAPDKPKGGKG